MHPSTSSGYARLQRLRMGLVLCGFLELAGCASAVPASSDAQSATAIRSKIDAAIGQAPCNADDQCRTLALGVNACGGPAAWRPWSTQTHGQGESLLALAEQYAAQQRQRQSQDGMVSTCRYIPNPGASCQAQHCVLKKAVDSAN